MVRLDDMLHCLGVVGAALIGAHFGRQLFGWPGAVGGLVLGPIAYVLLVTALLSVQDLLEREWPPVCHEGRCRGSFRRKPGDYEIVVVQDIADRQHHSLHRCRCGHYYEQLGKRFLERLPDGTLKPYMVHRPFRGWFPDETEER
jgi:hypothetical protein